MCRFDNHLMDCTALHQGALVSNFLSVNLCCLVLTKLSDYRGERDINANLNHIALNSYKLYSLFHNYSHHSVNLSHPPIAVHTLHSL